jgi:hypothetical protein
MRTTGIALLALALATIACGGREAVRVGVEVRGSTPEPSQELADLPASAIRDNIQRRLPSVSVDGLTLATSTRTERSHPAGGETVVKVWLECEVSHEARSQEPTKWRTRAVRDWNGAEGKVRSGEGRQRRESRLSSELRSWCGRPPRRGHPLGTGPPHAHVTACEYRLLSPCSPPDFTALCLRRPVC